MVYLLIGKFRIHIYHIYANFSFDVEVCTQYYGKGLESGFSKLHIL